MLKFEDLSFILGIKRCTYSISFVWKDDAFDMRMFFFLTLVLVEKHLFMNLYENQDSVSGQDRPVTDK